MRNNHNTPRTGFCPLCPATGFICFWGELKPYAPWRRWVLLACSVLLAALFGGILWFSSPELHWVLWVISVSMVLISGLGVATSVVGCERCVVRLYGDGGF